MRWRAIGPTALLGLACAVTVACGGGGGDRTKTIRKPSFPQGFLPALLEGSLLSDPCQSSSTRTAGDVALGSEGDLFAVAQTSDVYAVSRTNGSCRVFAHATPGNPTLLSIALQTGDETRFFAGDATGQIWVISNDGSSATVYIDTGSEPITGLAFAPKGYGDVAGSLLAAAGTSGILRITISDVPAVGTFAPSPGGEVVDLAFAKDTLFAIRRVDATHGQVDEIDANDTTGTVTTFQTGFIAPVGIAVDSEASEIYVADAGDDILKTVPVEGGATAKRARYDFDTFAANGLAFDGIATLAWITIDPLAIRGSNLPRVDPANENFGRIFNGPTSGYGDLDLDRFGSFVLVANDEDDPLDTSETDKVSNFLFSVPRDADQVETLESEIGTPPDQLFAVAIDPADQLIYFSSFSPAAPFDSEIHRRDADGNVTLLVSLSQGDADARVLGLELAPPTFGSFGGQLIATTQDGRVFAIDPAAPSSFVPIALSESVSHLVDLVFATTGELYAIDNEADENEANDPDPSRIVRIAPNGAVTEIAPPSAQLGLADAIEIDEGADRLFVTSQTAGGFQLLEVSLGATPTVKALANIEIDDGFFPNGVAYDRLGTVVHRKSDATTQLGAVSVSP